MSNSIWEELARSPLDPDPDHQPSLLEKITPVALAAIFGLLVGVFVLGGSGDGVDPATTVAAQETTTTSTAPPVPDPKVPIDYLDVDGIGVKAVAAYSRAGNLYLVLNEATRSDQSPAQTNGFHASHWVLAGDGVEINATRAIESHLAPGMTTLEFVGVNRLPTSSPRLLARRSSEMVVRTGCQGCGAVSAHEASGEVVLEGLARPYEIGEPLRIDVGSAITLSVDRLEFTDEWGYVEWQVFDENEGRIRADLRVIFEGTDDPSSDGVNPTQLIPEILFRPAQQNPIAANPQPFARSGALVLDRVGELISDTNGPTSLLMRWTVEWQHPVGEPIVIPLDATVDLGIID